jgi:2-oxoisovalerate dehydrogenase E2 component (dihydrolipoyl transacylase)
MLHLPSRKCKVCTGGYNSPQAGIITMEATVKRPWVINDATAIRSIMNLCVSLDHRVIDGSVASRFLQSVKRRLETFTPS